MIRRIIKDIFWLLKYEYLDAVKKMSNEELMPRLRAQIHVLEKRELEKIVDFTKMISARKYYYEAKKRGLLSSQEEEWCKKVLFGKTKTIKPEDDNIDSTKFSTLVKRRRSVRSWNQENIEKEKFRELVEAAKWAPSACNKQPWHFIITNDNKKIKSIYEVKGQKFLKDAPHIIICLINRNTYSNEKDCRYFSGLDSGVAIQNLLLKAEELNLGACVVNWKPSSISKSENEKIKKIFGIPNHLRIICIIPIGNFREKPSPPGRKDTNAIIHYEKFD